jgi:hypothetical protein
MLLQPSSADQQQILASAASLIAVSMPMPVSQPVIIQAGDEGRGLVWLLLKSHASVSKASFTSCHARSPGTATVPANNDSIFVLSGTFAWCRRAPPSKCLTLLS